MEHWEELRGSFCYCQKDNIIVVVIPIERRLGPTLMRAGHRPEDVGRTALSRTLSCSEAGSTMYCASTNP